MLVNTNPICQDIEVSEILANSKKKQLQQKNENRLRDWGLISLEKSVPPSFYEDIIKDMEPDSSQCCKTGEKE